MEMTLFEWEPAASEEDDGGMRPPAPCIRICQPINKRMKFEQNENADVADDIPAIADNVDDDEMIAVYLADFPSI